VAEKAGAKFLNFSVTENRLIAAATLKTGQFPRAWRDSARWSSIRNATILLRTAAEIQTGQPYADDH